VHICSSTTGKSSRPIGGAGAASDGGERFWWPATSLYYAAKVKAATLRAGGRIEAGIEGELMGTGGLHSEHHDLYI
jgi:hypothetical protein